MKGRILARDQRHAERMELAWTTAALIRQGTKLQSLASLLADSKPKKPQTPDDHLEALKALSTHPGVKMEFRLVMTREELDRKIAELEAAELDEEKGAGAP
jgi:hypothetical protein